MALNPTIQEVKQMVREPYAFPGGYAKVLVMSDGECLCAKCVKSNYKLISSSTRNKMRDGWDAVTVNINWEDTFMYCAQCGDYLAPEYGSDDE